MGTEAKYRFELKYICTEAQLAVLKTRMQDLLTIDPNAKNGIYCIRSLYFDDYWNNAFYENRNGTDIREKYRIRMYDNNAAYMRMELKRKIRGKTQKLSCAVTEDQCLALMQGQNIDMDTKLPPLMQILVSKYQSRLMRPKVVVEYDRTPYIYKNGNVRITLDLNIRSSNMINDFFQEELPSRLVMPHGRHIVEVKYDEFLPTTIRQIMQLEGVNRTTYSKYYFSRYFSL